MPTLALEVSPEMTPSGDTRGTETAFSTLPPRATLRPDAPVQSLSGQWPVRYNDDVTAPIDFLDPAASQARSTIDVPSHWDEPIGFTARR